MKLYLMKTRTWLKDNGYTTEEEAIIYDTLLQEIYENPRYFLDNLDSFVTFKVKWQDYRVKTTPIPYKYTLKSKPL